MALRVEEVQLPVIGRGRPSSYEQALQDQIAALTKTVQSVEAMPSTSAALTVPSYMISALPWAASYPNAIVNILDNPQGIARSVDLGGGVWHWTSEVDGSDLGVGNAPTS